MSLYRESVRNHKNEMRRHTSEPHDFGALSVSFEAVEGAIRLKSVADHLGRDATAEFVRWCSNNGLDIRRTVGLLAAVDEYRRQMPRRFRD